MGVSRGSFRAGMLALLAGGSVALASPVLAQVTTPVPTVAAAAEASAPVDPERLALARELFTSMHVEAAVRGLLANVFTALPKPTADGQDGARTQQFMASFSAGFDANFPELIDGMAQMYARELTTQELRDSAAFYGSPSGQAILSKMPALMQAAAPVSMKLMPKIAAAAEKDYCRRETCTEAEHAMFRRMEGMSPDGERPAASGV